MIHVLYKGRALPLAWRVRQGPKGHFPEDLHIALVELDVHFISSLPVMPGTAYKAWVDSKPVQMVWGVD